MGTECLFGRMGESWRWDSGDSCTTAWMCLMPLLETFTCVPLSTVKTEQMP